jgi:hypothetical protein
MTFIVPSDLVTRGEIDSGPLWRCLMCLTGGQGDEATVDLAVQVHREECSGDVGLAKMRFELLEMISGVSESWYAAGWMSGIEKVLLQRGGLWLLMAERVGFPTDWRGLEGWTSGATESLAYHGIDPAKVDVWPTELGAR